MNLCTFYLSKRNIVVASSSVVSCNIDFEMPSTSYHNSPNRGEEDAFVGESERWKREEEENKRRRGPKALSQV